MPKEYTIPLSILDKARVSKGSRGSAVSEGFQLSGLRSHVLMAACLPHELAGEMNGRGNFTSALLKTLLKDGTENMTYKDLIQRLPDVGE